MCVCGPELHPYLYLFRSAINALHYARAAACESFVLRAIFRWEFSTANLHHLNFFRTVCVRFKLYRLWSRNRPVGLTTGHAETVRDPRWTNYSL